MEAMEFQPVVCRSVATIANGQTVSSAVDLGGTTLCGLMMPAAFTGVALTFQGSIDGTNFAIVKGSDGNDLSLTVAAARYVKLNPVDFYGLRHLKLVSGSAEAAARDITLASRPL
jgi:hypothetical protein